MSALSNPNTIASKRRSACAYEYFKLGWDTVKIAGVMRISEAEAEKLVSIGRSQACGLPIPYEGV